MRLRLPIVAFFKKLFLLGTVVGAVVFMCMLLRQPTATAAQHGYRMDELQLIARLVLQTLEAQHYSQKAFDQNMANELFNEYFKDLDPDHCYFTQEDINNFDSVRQNLVNTMRQGDVSFAFAAHKLYVQRFEEYRKFAEERLKRPIDFTVDETIPAELNKAPWQKNYAELRKFWEKRLKADVLVYRMFDKAMRDSTSDDDKESKDELEDLKKWGAKSPEERLLKRLKDFHNELISRELIDITGIYLNSLAQVYGPHTNYASPKNQEDFDIQMSLSLTGIGATLTHQDGMIKVVSLTPGGPAERDGRLQPNDRIIAVTQENGDTIDLIDMPVSKAVQFIRGPKGSKIVLTIIPGASGKSGTPQTITLVREVIKIEESAIQSEVREVEVNGQKRRVGVIDFKSFYADFNGIYNGNRDAKRCSTDMLSTLKKLKTQNVDSILIDLRLNGGGSLSDALDICSMFVARRPILQVRDANGTVSQEYGRRPVAEYDGPLVILTSRMSASASEIFVGALRDNKRAVIIGDDRTFGKGTVLRVEEFKNLRSWFSDKMPTGQLTYACSVFYRPGGLSVQQLGLVPDITLPSVTGELEIGERFLDRHLTCDKIQPMRGLARVPNFESEIEILREDSAKRVAVDIEYQKLIKRLGYIQERRARKMISLNEKKRWSEYEKERNAQKQAEDVMREKADKKKRKSKDPVLREAEKIAAQLAILREKK